MNGTSETLELAGVHSHRVRKNQRMNLLKEAPDYQMTRTANGVWWRYLYTNGAVYAEFTSNRCFGGWPLVHIARGRSPETGQIATVHGIVAVGQKAVGVLAIGQAAAGVVALGQAAVGVLLGVGQYAAGIVAWGQGVLGIFGRGPFGLGPATLHTVKNLLR